MRKLLFLFIGLISLTSCSNDEPEIITDDKVIAQLLYNNINNNDQKVYEFKKYSISQDLNHYYFYNTSNNNEVIIDIIDITYSSNGINYGNADLYVKLNGETVHYPADYSKILLDNKIALYSTNYSQTIIYEFESDF